MDSSPLVLQILNTASTQQFTSLGDLDIKYTKGLVLLDSMVNQQDLQDLKPIRDQII